MPTPLPSYDDALAWLYARSRAGGARGPQRAAALLSDMAIPTPPLVVHVVGTNGKGTVTTMIAAGLTASGHRTGRFVSPHVESFQERIAVDGKPISRSEVRAFVANAMRRASDRPFAPELQPAFFEWTLALALAAFARAEVTAAVLEAGVGGASDATRAVEPVNLVVLTNVDVDHVEAIGPTLEMIARDKAGAFRPGVPAVTGARPPALDGVRSEAERIGAPLTIAPWAAEDRSTARPTEAGVTAADHDARRLFALPGGVDLGTRGTRAEDARLAAAAMRLLGLDERAVAAGVMAPPLPARGERFTLRGRDIVLDGAHDPAAAGRLADEVGGGYVLLFGALKRKAGTDTLRALARGARHVVLTEAEVGEGVVALPSEIAAHGAAIAEVVLAPVDALMTAIERCPRGGRVVIAGSLYLAGRLRPWLRRHARAAAPLGSLAKAGAAEDLIDSRTA